LLKITLQGTNPLLTSGLLLEQFAEALDAGGRMADPVAPFAIQPGEGTALETPTGDVITIKAVTSQTNGSLSVMEAFIGPKQGPALHTHLREDGLWYVVEGDFRFKAGEAMFRVSTGGMAFGPRGTPHCFQNIGDTPGRLLAITTPSGLERFFEQFAALLPGPVSPEAVAAVGHANLVEFVGPPAGVSDPL
jgi:mannose-6-phosphate isomerase-like protein (cupin superfamily)